MTRSTPSPPNDAGVKEAWNTNFGHDGDTSGPAAYDPDVDLSSAVGGLPLPIDAMQSDQDINGLLSFSAESGVDPFAGFDIPFWLGQDEYAGLVNEWS
jgi:hypothetical protein